MTEYGRPLPQPDDEDRPFWEAARRHELVLPHCPACGHTWFPPYAACPSCLSPDREWRPVSGRGRIDGYTIFDKPYLKAFADDVPYNVALVLLDEGPRMYSTVVGVTEQDLEVGMEVEVVFDDVTPEMTLPRFRPVD